MKRFGKYEILGKIGGGGFGTVYEARDPFLDRRLAIKTCSSRERELRERFFREARISAGLQHRNIVTVYDFGVEDDVPFLVQEFLDGEDLDLVIERGDALSVSRKVELLLQIAGGLAYAHACGVIHRDVKPGNVRVLPDGTAKLLDFGIAKLANVESQLTATGVTLGTAGYLPPEQILGGEVDHRTDLFAFGVLTYELLTGERPFEGRTISALFHRLLHNDPEPLTALWPACPPELETLVHELLEKDPRRRPSGFGEVILVLDEIRRSLGGGEAPAAEAAVRSEGPALISRIEDRRLRDKTGIETAARVVEELLAVGEKNTAEVIVERAEAAFGPREELPRVEDTVEQRVGERVDALIVEAHRRAEEGDLPGAQQAIREASKLAPDAAELAPLLERLEALERLDDVGSTSFAVDRSRIEELIEGEALDEAEAALQAAEKRHSATPFRDARRRLRRARGRVREREIASLLATARRALAHNELEHAIETLGAVLALDPDSPPALDLLAEIKAHLAHEG